MSTNEFVPIKFYLPGWPADIIEYPEKLGEVGARDIEVATFSAEEIVTSGVIQILDEIEAPLPLIPGLSVVLLSADDLTEIPFEFELLDGVFTLSLTSLGGALRVRSSLLQRVELNGNDYIPLLDAASGDPLPVDVIMESGDLTVNSAGEFTFAVASGAPSLSIEPFMIGSTGIVFDDLDIALVMSAEDATILPPTVDPSSRGVLINSASIHLPPDLQIILPSDISLEDTFIGSGGFSGKVSGEWNTNYNPNNGNLTGPATGEIFGFQFGLDSLYLEFVQNSLVASSITGLLVLPFFDEAVAVNVAIAGNGEVTVTLTGLDTGSGLLEISQPDLFTLAIASMTLASEGGIGQLTLGGSITPEFQDTNDSAGDEPPAWGTYPFEGLTIDTNGQVALAGGWLTLPEIQTLNFYGFQLEIAAFGIGNEEDGRRWIGFSGGIHLVDGLPVGGSVEGLRLLWDNNGNFDLELAGIGIDFEIEDTLQFSGAVAFINDQVNGIKGFRGGVRLQLTALNMWIDGQIVVMKQEIGSSKITAVYLFLEIGLPVGIPIFQTGQAIFAIAGLFSYNLLPGKADGDSWYDWYTDNPLGVTDAGKWSDIQQGSFAFGAGLAMGTLPDGFPFSAEVLLMILIPGPVLLIEGKAQFLTQRAELGDGSAAFTALAILDIPAGYFLFNVDVDYVFPNTGALRGFVIDMGAGAEAYFELGDPAAWHLYIGEKPKEKRIRADVFNLFRADAYLMLESSQIALGATIGYNRDWKFGVVRVHLYANISGDAIVSWKPTQFWGKMALGGGIDVRACGITVSLNAGADLELQTPTPYLLAASVWVKVKLPWPVKDFKTTLKLTWQEPDVPPIPLPLDSIAVEHLKVSDKWDLDLSPVFAAADNPGYLDSQRTQNQISPTVPVDGRLYLNFSKPVNDVTKIGDNYTIPSTEKVNDGEYKFDYYLDSITLYEIDGSQQTEVSDEIFGVWQWKNEGDPQNFCLLLWGRTPFDYTKQMITQTGYIQGLLNSAGNYPCAYPTEPEEGCVNFDDRDIAELPEFIWQDGFVFHFFRDWEINQFQATICDTEKAMFVFAVGEPLSLFAPQPLARLDIYVSIPEKDPHVSLTAYFDDGSSAVYEWGMSGENMIRIEEANKRLTYAVFPEGQTFTILQLCYITPEALETSRGYVELIEQLGQGITEHWAGEAELLKPNTHYKLKVLTRTERRGPGGEDREEWFEQTAIFQTGGPPGSNGSQETSLAASEPTQVYPSSGQLVDLSSYIQSTVPPIGGLFHYRSYDIGLLFNESYVEQMYLMHGDPLVIEIVDNNGQPLRDENGQVVQLLNSWGDNPTSELDVESNLWVTHLSQEDCLDIATETRPPKEELLGTLPVDLKPLTMYEAQLKSGNHIPYRFNFYTSRFVDFADHIASYTAVARVWNHAAPDTAPALAGIVNDLGPNYAAVIVDGGTTYDPLALHYDLSYRPLPEILEITAVKRKVNIPAMLIESPEPLDPARVTLLVKELNEDGSIMKKHQTVLVTNQDHTRFLLYREAKSGLLRPWQPGKYQLQWSYSGDIGPQGLLLKQGGTAVSESAFIEIEIE